MTIDERIEALTMNLELMSRDAEAQHERLGELVETVEKLVGTVEKFGADRAASHERRLNNLEGGIS